MLIWPLLLVAPGLILRSLQRPIESLGVGLLCHRLRVHLSGFHTADSLCALAQVHREPRGSNGRSSFESSGVVDDFSRIRFGNGLRAFPGFRLMSQCPVANLYQERMRLCQETLVVPAENYKLKYAESQNWLSLALALTVKNELAQFLA